MMAIEERDSGAFLSVALGKINNDWHWLEHQKSNHVRAKIIREGLSQSARYLDTLGVFIWVPVLSAAVKFPNPMAKLYRVNFDGQGIVDDAADENGIRHYISPTGRLIEVECKNKQLLWDEKKWLTSRRDICAVGEPALRQIRATFLKANGVSAKTLAAV